jgi:hypothetical protein
VLRSGCHDEARRYGKDKQNNPRYHKPGERPDRYWTGRPGRSPRQALAGLQPLPGVAGRHASGPRGFPAGAAGSSGLC